VESGMICPNCEFGIHQVLRTWNLTGNIKRWQFQCCRCWYKWCIFRYQNAPQGGVNLWEGGRFPLTTIESGLQTDISMARNPKIVVALQQARIIIRAPLPTPLCEIEAEVIRQFMVAAEGNIRKAAAALHIDRHTLKRKLTKYGLVEVEGKTAPALDGGSGNPPEQNPGTI